MTKRHEYAVTTLRDRDAEYLRALFVAHPLPLPTRTLARAVLQVPGGPLASAEKRTWETLRVLEDGGLVRGHAEADRPGRPPIHWRLLPPGIAALRSRGDISDVEVRQKPRSHKAVSVYANRRHDLLVHDLASAVRLASRSPAADFTVVEIATDKFTWRTVTDTHGAVHSVAPDLVLTLSFRGERVVLFVEVQGVAPRLGAVEDKLDGFLAYLGSGAPVAEYAARQFRILFVTFSPAERDHDHRNNIAETALAVPAVAPVVRVATLADILDHGFDAPVFLSPVELHAALAALPERDRAVLTEARHAVNRIRQARDRFVAERVPARRWFE